MRKAFTLAELLVVVAILTIIAAYGIPNYNMAQRRSVERAGVASMRVIAQALELYKSNTGTYPNFPMSQIGDINDDLNLGILEQNYDYTCEVPNGPSGSYKCEAAASSEFGWTLRYTTGDGDVSCTGGCPTCTGSSCPF